MLERGTSRAYEPKKFKYNALTNLSTIDGTATIVAIYSDFVAPITNEKYDTVQLSYVHEYVPLNLKQVIAKQRFEILGQFDGDGFVYFWLRNPD